MRKYFKLDGASQKGKDIDSSANIRINTGQIVHQITKRKIRDDIFHVIGTDNIVEIPQSIIERYFRAV